MVSHMDASSMFPHMDAPCMVPHMDTACVVPHMDASCMVPHMDAPGMVPDMDAPCTENSMAFLQISVMKKSENLMIFLHHDSIGIDQLTVQ